MLQHLWRSLTEFRRRPRPITQVPLTPQKRQSFLQDLRPVDGIGVKIDGKTIRQNADGELFADFDSLGLKIPGSPS